MLRSVVASTDAGNITEAPRRLNVSQSSISAAVSQLEATVGWPGMAPSRCAPSTSRSSYWTCRIRATFSTGCSRLAAWGRGSPPAPGHSNSSVAWWGHGLGYSLHNVLPCTGVAYDGSHVAALPIQEALAPVRIMRLRLRRGAKRPAVQAFRWFLDRAFDDICPE